MRTIGWGIAALVWVGVVWAEPPAPAPSGGTVEGRVARAGMPVANARVGVRRPVDPGANLDGYGYGALFERLLAGRNAWTPVATTAGDAAGRFAVSGLAPGVYDAESLSADGTFAHASVTVPAAGARVEANVDL